MKRSIKEFKMLLQIFVSGIAMYFLLGLMLTVPVILLIKFLTWLWLVI